MLVFNLTNQPLVFRKRTIPPEGSFDFKDMTFVPGRDKALEQAGVLSFGSRPKGWKSAKAVPAPVTLVTLPPVMLIDPVTVKEAVLEAPREEVKVEEKVDFGVKKKKF